MVSTDFVVKAATLAFVVEALLEYIFGIWWQPCAPEIRPKVLMAAGLILGVILCFLYKMDVLAQFGMEAPYIGNFVTGAIVGRGSEYFHQFYNLINGSRLKELLADTGKPPAPPSQTPSVPPADDPELIMLG